MNIILLQDVKTLGKKGDVVEVSAGYARNMILPKSLVPYPPKRSQPQQKSRSVLRWIRKNAVRRADTFLRLP